VRITPLLDALASPNKVDESRVSM